MSRALARIGALPTVCALIVACSTHVPPAGGSGASSDAILNGSVASAYPEAALVGIYQKGQLLAFCSGSVIAPHVVLTAGHCVMGESGPQGFTPDGWSVTAPYSSGGGGQSTYAAVYDWPQTNGSVDPNFHDIGLVFISAPIQLASYPSLATAELADNSAVVNIGRIDNGKLSTTDLYVSPNVAVVDGTSDGYSFDYSAVDEIEAGDSGGPDEVPGSSPHLIVAVNSGAGQGNEVLARVDLPVISQWIQQRISSAIPVCNLASTNAPCRKCTSADDNNKNFGCSDTTPFCATGVSDPNLGHCVECRDSSGCSGNTPVCETSSGSTQDTCRACAADAECPKSTPLCETSGSNAGRCVECTPANTTLCKSPTPFCDASAETCVACVSNTNCSGTAPICDAGTRTCRPCVNDFDCQGNGVCVTAQGDPVNGRCAQCNDASQCSSPSMICDPAKHACVGCAKNDNCSNPRPVCGQDETCQGCTNDVECAGSPNGGSCLTSGPTAGSCARCSPTDATACPADSPVCNGDNGACVACNVTSDCKDPSKACSADHTCVKCGGDAGACPATGGGGCSVALGPRSTDGAWALPLVLACAIRRRRPPRTPAAPIV